MLTYTVRGPLGQVHTHTEPYTIPQPGMQLPATGVGYWTRCGVGTCWVDATGLVHAPGDPTVGGQVVTLQQPAPMTVEQFKVREPANYKLWWSKAQYASGFPGDISLLVKNGLAPFKVWTVQENKYGAYYSAQKQERRDARIFPDLVERVGGAIYDAGRSLVGGLLDAACHIAQSSVGPALAAGGAAAAGLPPQVGELGRRVAVGACGSGGGAAAAVPAAAAFPPGSVTRWNVTRNVWVIYAPGAR